MAAGNPIVPGLVTYLTAHRLSGPDTMVGAPERATGRGTPYPASDKTVS